jgi:hypothetical protein
VSYLVAILQSTWVSPPLTTLQLIGAGSKWTHRATGAVAGALGPWGARNWARARVAAGAHEACERPKHI